MTKIVIRKNNGRYTGFTCSGHAGYADSGSDIVCASVSVLVINTINAMEAFAAEKMEGHLSESIKEERANVIKKISAEKYKSFLESNIGKDAEVLIEKHLDKYGKYKGLTRNYITVQLNAGEFNTLKKVQLTQGMLKY